MKLLLSCSRSSQCTNLKSHRLLVQWTISLSEWPALLSYGVSKASDQVVVVQISPDPRILVSLHMKFNLLGRWSIFCGLADSTPSIGVLWSMVANNSNYFTSRQWSLSPPNPKLIKLLPPLSYHMTCSVGYFWEPSQDVRSVLFNSYLLGSFCVQEYIFINYPCF